jgi:hypothetical protein
MTAARLFPTLLDGAFGVLPAPVQALHRAPGGTRFIGHADVTRGQHPLARLMSAATRLPPAGRVDVEVGIDVDSTNATGVAAERWRRRFGRHAMPSRLWAHGGRLRERLGVVTFDFALSASAEGLRWRITRVRALGLPLPVRWFAGVVAHESERDGRYAFEVRAALPHIGLLVHYRGQLDVG